METELINLELEEVSLVPAGDDPLAKVAIIKCRDLEETEKGNKMTEEQDAKVKAYMEKHSCGKDEAMKALGYEMEKAEADPTEELNAEIDTLKAENERLRKGLIDEGYVIKAEAIEKKAPEEFVEYEGEQINKADIPAPILKALEAAEIEKADVALTKKAEETLPHFAVDAAKGLLSAVSKMDEAEILIEALMAADKAFADKMEELGKSDVDGEFSSANDKLEHMVKSHMDENNLTYAKAYAAIARTEEGKTLIAKAYKGE